MLRKIADQKLEEFLTRVEEVKRNSYFLYKVKEVKLFGSYLTSKERIGDIDTCVSLAPKEEDDKKHWELHHRRVEQVLQKGKRFRDNVDRISWPQIEVLKYLKARSRSISLHLESDGVFRHCEPKVIYTDATGKLPIKT